METTVRVKYEFCLAGLAHMVQTINNTIDEAMLDIFDISYGYSKKDSILTIEYIIEGKDMLSDILDEFFKKSHLEKTKNVDEDYECDFVFYDLDSLLDEVTPCQLDLSDVDMDEYEDEE